MSRIVILGAGGYGRLVEDLISQRGDYTVAGFIDEDPSTHGTSVNGIPVLGGEMMLPDLLAEGVSSAVVALGDNDLRARVFQKVADLGFKLPIFIHPRATVGRFVEMAEGVVVLAGAVINTGAVLGRNVVVNVQASIDHDCVLKDHSQVWPGANLAGNVIVGKGSYVGTGASVIPGIKIGDHSIVGAGSSVVRDIPDNVVATGVPARPKRDRTPR